MSRWSNGEKATPEEAIKVEVEGMALQCSQCYSQHDKAFYLPEVKALTWKCPECDHINILEDFKLF